MFNFFRRRTSKEFLEEAKETYNVPSVPAPEPEKPATVFYRLGLTDNNRVSFSMGYTEITMNSAGVQQMIDQLVFFQNQLREEESGIDSK